ncbi:MAG: aryl-sulfate sulfotransferase [Gemmatimonadota bacterium]
MYVALAILAAACSDATAPVDDTDPPPGPTVSVEQLSTLNPLTRGFRVDVAPTAAVTVDYWTEGEPRLRVRSDPGQSHELLVGRLLPDATYEYEVAFEFDDATVTVDPATGSFVTDTLPTFLQAVTLTSTGESTSPLVMLELREPTFQGFAAVDSKGRVVWYHPTTGGSWSWTRRANGNFVFLDTGAGLNEVTPAGDIVATLARANNESIHHDVIATPQNTVYFLTRHPQLVDGITWVGEIIWEWNPDTGGLAERWNSFDFLSPSTDTTSRSTRSDWLHGNSLNVGPAGGILLSSPWLNQVIAISSDFTALAWRLGGKNATIFTDSAGTFNFQHTASRLSENRVLVFDNRGGGTSGFPVSRALELEVDFAADSARAVWSFQAPNDNYASIISAARRMANGNTMVTFGTSDGFRESRGPIEVYEVAPGGSIVWNLVVEGPALMYRATPFGDIAGEVEVP